MFKGKQPEIKKQIPPFMGDVPGNKPTKNLY